MSQPSALNILLPSWRQGRLLFFTSFADGYTTRLDYRVAAATAAGETKVKRTFKAPVSAEDLEKCQKTADNGPALQRFFHMLGRGNLDELLNETPLPPCAEGVSPLIYMCSYFNFLRKYSVDQTLVKHYEAQTPKNRMNAETALPIYKTLSAHLQPDRAVLLLNADLPDINNVKGGATAVANLLREAAIIRYDAGDNREAINTMLRAAKLHNTEDKWRRLADFAIADNLPEKAIEYFEKAESLAPLAPPQSLRLARLMIEASRSQEAMPYLDRAEAVFKAPVEALRKKVAAKSSATNSTSLQEAP
ncbi:MAG: hypothetical protein L3J37_10635 [Rhodobacteraceae bacterium]|nr:hypothetical protein [Paracoccaceae bacterium]